MTLALVFNHDSLPCESIEIAQKFVTQFVKLALASNKRFGFELILLDTTVDEAWFGIELVVGYFWRDWFDWAKKQPELRDSVRAFRAMKTRQPMLLPIDSENIEYTIEVSLPDKSIGLRTLQAAYWYQTFLLSFPTSKPWNQSLIDVFVTKLCIETSELVRNITHIKNLCDDVSLTIHENDLQALRNQYLQAGKDIWEQRAVFFPKLYLLDNKLGNQLRHWSHRTDVLTKAKDTLFIMNDFVVRWQSGEFSDYRHEYLQICGLAAEVSGESNSVAQNPRKRAEREFWLPTAKKVYCEYHVKLPTGFRLHFYPCCVGKTIYVVYLGPHLSL